ncbi:MAG TPA: hypothetical protein VJ851_04460 [Jatrophihabitans sp.]|nr:hypothetical protein [Jatrophihabitans sp.]
MVIGLFWLVGLAALFGYGIWMRRGTSAGLSARGLDPAQAAKLGYRGPQQRGSYAVPKIQAAQLDCRTD